MKTIIEQYEQHAKPLIKHELAQELENDVRTELKGVDLNHNGFIPMLSYSMNISFKVKDVHINFNQVFQHPIQLNRGQFRFALYNLNNHPNFLTEINNYL